MHRIFGFIGHFVYTKKRRGCSENTSYTLVLLRKLLFGLVRWNIWSTLLSYFDDFRNFFPFEILITESLLTINYHYFWILMIFLDKTHKYVIVDLVWEMANRISWSSPSKLLPEIEVKQVHNVSSEHSENQCGERFVLVRDGRTSPARGGRSTAPEDSWNDRLTKPSIFVFV